MFPCKFCLSTRTTNELVARRAIRALEGKDIDDVSEYVDPSTEKYDKMVKWIERDLEVTTLRYQNIQDMIDAIGLPREKLCLYCWTGECPKAQVPSLQKKGLSSKTQKERQGPKKVLSS